MISLVRAHSGKGAAIVVGTGRAETFRFGRGVAGPSRAGIRAWGAVRARPWSGW